MVIVEQIENIDQALLDELVQNRTPESVTLKFKAELPNNSDTQKREFLKDVCAMANAQGGDIVYGIAEDKGVADKLVPISGESADAVMRRLGQLLESCVTPRLAGIRMHPVSANGNYVLIIRVP